MFRYSKTNFQILSTLDSNSNLNFPHSKYTPLIFGTNTDFKSIKTILFIIKNIKKPDTILYYLIENNIYL